MSSVNIADPDIPGIGNELPSVFIPLAGLSSTVKSLQNQDGTGPGIEQASAAIDPLLSECRGVEVPHHGLRYFGIRIFLNGALDVFVRHWPCAKPPVAQDY